MPNLPTDLSRLFHQLNNQLGIILANAELLESRLTDDTHRSRAGQVVSSALDAIETTKYIREMADSDHHRKLVHGCPALELCDELLGRDTRPVTLLTIWGEIVMELTNLARHGTELHAPSQLITDTKSHK